MNISDEPSTAPDEVAGAPSAARPVGAVLLFDGHCNLCNSTVQWVIEHDRKGRIRFAALQSEAARKLLAGANLPEPLPDSVILLDKQGVHTRSTAALRLCKALGFPYLLLTVFMLIPHALRDAAYRWVARHRYAWFGTRETCMRPTDDLRARFLDATEPQPDLLNAPAAPREDANESTGRALGRMFVRFSGLYLIIYMLPFPLTLLGLLFQIPGVNSIPWLPGVISPILGAHSAVMTPVVEWIGANMLGVEVSAQPNGSGDRLFNFIDAGFDLTLAILITAVWSIVRWRKPISRSTADIGRTLVRYYLAYYLLVYGWLKTFPLQFPAPSFDRLLQPYGDSSPMGLMWTFMGASTPYQIFAGLCELTAGYLIFFRRTTTLGALMATGVMLNVFLMNMFYDVPVKLFSFHLLLCALFLAAPDIPRLIGLLVVNVPVAPRRLAPCWAHVPPLRWLSRLAQAAVIIAMTFIYVTSGIQRLNDPTRFGAPHEISGMYRVESFELGDGDITDGNRWVRVGINAPYAAAIQRADGVATRMRCQVNQDEGTLAIFDRGAQPPEENPLHYSWTEDDLLRIEGQWDGAPIAVTLRRTEDASLLRTRGFHWINEYPFNR